MDECFTIFRDERVYCNIEFDISNTFDIWNVSFRPRLTRIPINVKKSKKKKKSPLLASTAKYRQVLIWNARSRRDSGAFNQLAARISLPSSSPLPRCKNLDERRSGIPAERSHGSRKGEETATKYCVRAENTALGTRVSGIPYEQIGPPIIR